MFHISARCHIGAVPAKARTPRRAEFLAQPTTPSRRHRPNRRQLNKFQTEPEPQTNPNIGALFVFAPKNAQKRPTLLVSKFNQSAASHEPGNMFACTLRLSRRHNTNGTSSASTRTHTNLTSIVPAYRRQQNPHQQGPIWVSCFLTALSRCVLLCAFCAFCVSCFRAFVLSVPRSVGRAPLILPCRSKLGSLN